MTMPDQPRLPDKSSLRGYVLVSESDVVIAMEIDGS
jgi:hypothetical protein